MCSAPYSVAAAETGQGTGLGPYLFLCILGNVKDLQGNKGWHILGKKIMYRPGVSNPKQENQMVKVIFSSMESLKNCTNGFGVFQRIVF